MPRSKQADSSASYFPPVRDPDETETDTTEASRLLDAGVQAGEDQNENTGNKPTWSGLEDFEGLPWWKTPSVYWLLAPFAIFTLAFGGVIVPKLNL